MPDVTRLLDAATVGDRRAASDLLLLVYDELRRLAASRMADEQPGHTLQPTALVHEAYLRLIGPADAARWENRGHFFAAAAEAMRRILVDAARRRNRLKHGGDRRPVPLEDVPAPPGGTTCSRSTPPSRSWRPKTRRPPGWSNSATSPG